MLNLHQVHHLPSLIIRDLLHHLMPISGLERPGSQPPSLRLCVGKTVTYLAVLECAMQMECGIAVSAVFSEHNYRT